MSNGERDMNTEKKDMSKASKIASILVAAMLVAVVFSIVLVPMVNSTTVTNNGTPAAYVKRSDIDKLVMNFTITTHADTVLAGITPSVGQILQNTGELSDWGGVGKMLYYKGVAGEWNAASDSIWLDTVEPDGKYTATETVLAGVTPNINTSYTGVGCKSSTWLRIKTIDAANGGIWNGGADSIIFEGSDDNTCYMDKLNATTFKLTTDCNGTNSDISALSLWRESGVTAGFQSNQDIRLKTVTYTAGTSSWNFGSLESLNTFINPSATFYVTVNISGTANYNRTIKMQIPPLDDRGTTGSYQLTDQGIFFNGTNDTGGKTNVNKLTIDSTGDGGGGGTPTLYAEAGGPYLGYLNKFIAFSGSRSTKTGGTITGYRWDWTNDGTYNTDWSANASATHAYTRAGTYTVKLQIKDDSNVTAIDTAIVIISIGPGITASQNVLDRILTEYGIHLIIPFYANDTNGDGKLDTFTDPNNILTNVRSMSKYELFLISTNNDNIPEFAWDTTSNTITHVDYLAENIIDEVDNTTLKTRTVTTISIEKNNWTYVEVADLYPDNPNLIVKTSDGRTISSDWMWRANGKVFIFDNPATQYLLVYSFAGKGSLFDVIVELTKDSVSADEGNIALITLINVGEPGTVNGTVNYSLSKGGLILWSTEEAVSVLGQISFNKTIETKNLVSGTYTYTVVYSYGVNQTASSQKMFTITSPVSGFPLLWIIVILLIIIIASVIIFIAWKKGFI